MTLAYHFRGLTLIELLTSMAILSILTVMSYRTLDGLTGADSLITRETEKWQRVSAFWNRLQQDVQLSAPRSIRQGAMNMPAWRGSTDSANHSLFEFNRLAIVDADDIPRRIGYRLNERQEIELLLWSGLDLPASATPARYPVLSGVTSLICEYLGANHTWSPVWPLQEDATTLPRAMRVHIVLTTGEEVMRMFVLRT